MPSDKFYSTKAWIALRKQVLVRDNYCCVLCGDSVKGYKRSRVDHVVPRKVRPELALSIGNLRTLCVPCDLRYDNARANNVRPIVRVGVDGLPEDGSWG
jgi:5-methylcytosine-specific restriction endonuclease McrA